MNAIFDPHIVRQRRLRALRGDHGGADFLMRAAADDLADRLSTVERRFAQAGLIHDEVAHGQAALAATRKVDAMSCIDARAETLPVEPASLDLAISLYGLGQMNDVPGMLIQIRRALRPDGLFLGCVAGAGTLRELRESLLAADAELSGGAAMRIHPFIDVKDAGVLLQRAGFALPVADLEKVTVRYDTMFALMRDLRAMGMTNALMERSRRPATRALFLRAAEIYAERFADPDGRVRASFVTVWMSGWSPHESQQKPLPRGSATVSLKKVLGAD